MGWNFGFIGGSILLTEAPERTSDRFIVQSISEFIRSIFMVAAVLCSNAFSYSTMQFVLLIILGCTEVLVLAHFLTLPDVNIFSGCRFFKKCKPVVREVPESRQGLKPKVVGNVSDVDETNKT